MKTCCFMSTTSSSTSAEYLEYFLLFYCYPQFIIVGNSVSHQIMFFLLQTLKCKAFHADGNSLWAEFQGWCAPSNGERQSTQFFLSLDYWLSVSMSVVHILVLCKWGRKSSILSQTEDWQELRCFLLTVLQMSLASRIQNSLILPV